MHATLDVGDVVILEAAHHLDDGVRLPDVAQEGIAQSFSLAGAPHQTGDVHKFLGGGQNPLGIHDGRQGRQAGIWHVHDPGIGLDGAEGVVGRSRPSAGKSVEKGGLSYIGETHDATGDSHSNLQAFQYLRDQM